MLEETQKRTEYTKTYNLGDGRKRIISKTQPIHYDDNGVMKDIDMAVVNGRINKCPYDVSLLKDKIGYEGFAPDGKRIRLEMTGTYKPPVINGNEVTYVDIEPGVDFVLTFWPTFIKAVRVLKNETALKTAIYKSYREDGIKGELVNYGYDAQGRRAELKITQADLERGVKEITQVFTGRVMNIDPKTRKRDWTTRVEYPVYIDPTNTFTISTNADDGAGIGRRPTYITSVWTATYVYDVDRNQFGKSTTLGTFATNNRRFDSYLRFAVSGIPNDATIDSATLNVYAGRAFANTTLKIRAAKSASPAIPATFPAITGISTTGGVVSTAVTNALSPFTDKADYLLKAIDVTALVSALQSLYDYSSARNMLFTGEGGTSYVAGQYGFIYAKNWGSAKDPELVIEYTEAASGGARRGGLRLGLGLGL